MCRLYRLTYRRFAGYCRKLDVLSADNQRSGRGNAPVLDWFFLGFARAASVRKTSDDKWLGSLFAEYYLRELDIFASGWRDRNKRNSICRSILSSDTPFLDPDPGSTFER